jgi:hypothetical protein
MAQSSEARLYASAIAVVSGIYSIVAAVAGGMASMPMSESIMLVVGIAVLVHGIILLTPAAERLGRASGPLMVLWAAIMLGNQALAATSASGSMMTSDAMSWDGGMVAIAVLMLASGLIMIRARQMP